MKMSQIIYTPMKPLNNVMRVNDLRNPHCKIGLIHATLLTFAKLVSIL